MRGLPSYLLAFGLGISLTAINACGGKGESCVDHCLPGEEAIWCSHGLQAQSICGPDQSTAALSCDASGGAWSPATVCSGGNDEGTSSTTGYPHTPWDPGLHVHFDEVDGAYVIEQDFFEGLKDDPSPLADDSTVLRQLESGHYQVVEVGELADALGWQAGDILRSVDSKEIGGLSAFVEAYAELADQRNFTLKLDRDGHGVVLFYRLE